MNDLLADSAIHSGGGRQLRLVAPQPRAQPSSPGYETRAYLTGELETREEHWHDLFNALVWLTFPQTKATLNARHYTSLRGAPRTGERGPEQDTLTLFDESGVIVASSDPSLLALQREFAWKRLFWERREEVLNHMRVFLIGHGLYEQALQPFMGMTGKAVLIEVDQQLLGQPLTWQIATLDERVATLVGDADKFRRSRDLAPLPVLGVPGWAPDNGQESYYDNTDYFRPGRKGAAETKP